MHKPEIKLPSLLSHRKEFVEFTTAGDFGGTKSRLVLNGRTRNGVVRPLLKISSDSGKSLNLERIFAEYEEEVAKLSIPHPEITVIGCAGEIRDQGRYCKLTNENVELDTREIKKFGFDALLINDFMAIALGIPTLNTHDEKQTLSIKHLSRTTFVNQSTAIALIGPGSGLGWAPLYLNDGTYVPQPSEGGHISYASKPGITRYLDDYLREKVTNGTDPTLELVASGIGIKNILDFFYKGELPHYHQDKRIKEIRSLRKHHSFEKFMDIINERKPSEAARKMIKVYHAEKDTHLKEILKYALEIFIDATAQAARNAANSILAGSVYIAGGNARRLAAEFTTTDTFMNVFDNSYSHTRRLRATPVYVVTSPTIPTDGAGVLAFLRYDKNRR